MAIVVIKKEPRQVSGKLIRPNERCTVPDGLARALENKGLCEIVSLENRLERQVEAEAKEAQARKVETKAVPKKKATKKKGKS